MLKTLFGKNKHNVIFTTNDYEIIKCSVQELGKIYEIKNWEKNRPADPVRVCQIKQYYIDEKVLFVDGTISSWAKNNDLYVYDGIHRLEAAIATPHEMSIIIKIVKNQNESYIVSDFKRINSSVAIPYLYLEDKNELKRNVCESVMNLMCKKFPNCISASRNPWKCNFNRDNFIEHILSKANIDYQKPHVDKLLFQTLLGINDKAKNYVYKNKIEHFKKCETFDFFIMYFNNELIINEIETSELLQ
jgi:hypothetical protein